MSRGTLGPLEQIIMLALIRLGPMAYGMSIRRHVLEKTGRDVSIGAMYTTLERLEQKGFVSSRLGDATAERGGRAKKYFRIEAPGHTALSQAMAHLSSLSDPVGVQEVQHG